MAATALKTVLYRPFPGGFFMVIISPPPRKVFYIPRFGAVFYFMSARAPLLVYSNVPHIIKNPGPINPGSFHSFKTTLIF